MRTLSDHITNPANQELEIQVMDDPGPGGACHDYQILIHSRDMAAFAIPGGPYRKGEEFQTGAPIAVDDTTRVCSIRFQNGPIQMNGVNGITQEALLAIVIDRLRGFQSGPYACEENGVALRLIEGGLDALKDRTRKRIERGVEGTDQL